MRLHKAIPFPILSFSATIYRKNPDFATKFPAVSPVCSNTPIYAAFFRYPYITFTAFIFSLGLQE
jgi:hypothetical protein